MDNDGAAPEAAVPPDVVLHDFNRDGAGAFRSWVAWLGAGIAAAWRLVRGRRSSQA